MFALRTYMYVKKTHHRKTVLTNELSAVEERGVWISCRSKVEPYSNWTQLGGFGINYGPINNPQENSLTHPVC